MKKSAQKFGETIESFIVKTPEYERERQKNLSINNEEVTQNNENDDTLRRRSKENENNLSDIIDSGFKKINKKRKYFITLPSL